MTLGRHSTCESHKKRELQKETSKSMKSFLISKEDDQVDKITAAEVTSVYHSVQHAQECNHTDPPTVVVSLPRSFSQTLRLQRKCHVVERKQHP